MLSMSVWKKEADKYFNLYGKGLNKISFKVKDSWDHIGYLAWLDDFMIGHKGFIAGGCFKNIFNKERVKDVDVFFESEKDFLEAKKYYEDSEDWYLYYENKKVISFKRHKKPEVAIELIRTTYGTPEEILNRFDFSITKFAYFKDTEEGEIEGEEITVYKVMYDENFFEHLQLKRLVVDNDLLFPVGTFERMLRYAKYGYFPCKATKTRIINNLRTTVIDEDNISASLYDGLD